MKRYVVPFLSALLVLAGCASEDMSIVDPAPGSRRILVRLFNMVPDGTSRRLVLEQGFQSIDVAPLQFSDSVRSPGDSSFIEIYANGTREFRTGVRARFVQNAIYDVFTLAEIGRPTVFDTVLVTNANAALTTVPVAQVRLVNLIPDTSRAFDVRLGCPSGISLVRNTVPFGQASLYTEVFPGPTVFSIVDVRNQQPSVIGTFECQLAERTPYSIVMYRDAASDDALIMFVQEDDFTRQAVRPFVPIEARTADVRAVNLSTGSVKVTLPRTSTTIASGLPQRTSSAFVAAVTCESERPDVVTVAFADGREVVDSTSLVVRGTYTVYASDSGSRGQVVITPAIQRPFGSTGFSVVRVVNTSTIASDVVVSVGARTDPSAPGTIVSGVTIARNVRNGSFSAPVAVRSGVVPVTITTANRPTRIIDVTTFQIEPNKNYDLVVYDEDGQAQTMLIEEREPAGVLRKLDEGAFVYAINGSSRRTSMSLQLGNVIASGTLFPGSTIATTLPVGAVPYNVNGVNGTVTTRNGERSLLVYAEGGGTPGVITITTPPLLPQAGITRRRVINATEDVARVSISIDSIPGRPGEGEYLAADVPFGTASDASVTNLDRRGTYYVYDAATRIQLYTLPVQLAPLGSNFSLIVVGRKETGYEVIVTQEF
jgi:hypothetical protein